MCARARVDVCVCARAREMVPCVHLLFSFPNIIDVPGRKHSVVKDRVREVLQECALWMPDALAVWRISL